MVHDNGMNSDKERRKKELRTQGKYLDIGQQSKNKKKGKNERRGEQTKMKSESGEDYKDRIQAEGETMEKPSCVTEANMNVTYVENSHYDVPVPEPIKAPVEIKDQGVKVLSTTQNGDSRILYYPSFMSVVEAFELLDYLKNATKWRQLNVMIHGRAYPQPRLVAWFGPFPYGYSGVHLEPQEMPNNILEIKKRLEDFLNKQGIDVEFNSVLMNLYEHEKHSVAWHSDDELSMGIHPTIASMSLGAVRKFEMRRKPTANNSEPRTEYFVNLKNGSLLVMDGVMQMDWQHRVPKEPGKEVAPRINLTFRRVFQVASTNRTTK